MMLNAGYVESLIQATSLNYMQLDDLRNWEFFQEKLKTWIQDLLELNFYFFKVFLKNIALTNELMQT